MRRNVKVGSQAWHSVRLISEYLTTHASLTTARRFYRSFQMALETLAEFPEIGAVWESPEVRLKDMRFWPLRRPFQKYLVFYRYHHSNVEVVEVIHGSRDINPRLLDK